MIFNVLVLLLIVLVTLYLSTQGMLSSLLAFATSVFSSILAMALMEPLQGLIGGWRPDYGRGLTFLLLFLIIFAVTRVAADLAVPKNIKVSLWVNRLAGGLIGFFAALVIVGTIVVGVEMLPLPSTILGYDRFPTETVMKGENPGEVTRQRNGVWLAPDRFVLKIWNGASGRALGGARPWASVHPDLSVESYGYRYTVAKSSARSAPLDLFDAPEAWVSNDPKELQALGIPFEAGKRIAMIRTTVQKGPNADHTTADAGVEPFFRVSATQVRMVTDKDRQYYPIGHLEFGRKFVPLPLDSGHLVDDYVKTGVVTEDWVFEIPEEEMPAVIEVKQFGRKILADVKAKAAPALASGDYPQHPYLKDLGSVAVQIDVGSKKLIEANVYIIKPAIKTGDIHSEVVSADQRAQAILGYINGNSNGWVLPKKGVPPKNMIVDTARNGYQLTTSADPTLPWTSVLKLLLVSNLQSDGDQNYQNLPRYFDEKVLPLMRNASDGNIILDSAKLTQPGTAEINRVLPGAHSILVTVLTNRGYFIFLDTHEFVAKDTYSFSVNGEDGGPDAKRLIGINLDEQVAAPQ